jgi:hypothetical protein
MNPVRTTLLAFLMAGLVTSASAQSSRSAQSPARSPIIIESPTDLYRGPPPPPDRAYTGPVQSLAAPMERVPQVAPLSPRVGN